MILTTTSPHNGYSFLYKYDTVIQELDHINRKGEPIELPVGTKLVVFTGGSDVSAFMYGRKAHPTSHGHPKRDYLELLMWEAAQRQGVPVLGICRGMQFINVMCGGELVQHTSGHAGRGHSIVCLLDSIKGFNGGMVTSLHHQMIIPTEDAKVAAVSRKRSYFYLTAPKTDHEHDFSFSSSREEIQLDIKEEVEAVIYKKQKAVGVQFHPELCMPGYHVDILITQKLIEEYLL